MLTIVQDIENLDTLTGLEELWLGKNKITELKVTLLPLVHRDTPSHMKTEYITSQQPQDTLHTVEPSTQDLWPFQPSESRRALYISQRIDRGIRSGQ